MFSWKDKVTEKVSGLFSDSPSSVSPALDQHLAKPYSNDGKSLSSILSVILPSANFEWFRSNKHPYEIKPIESLPVKFSSSLSWQDKPLDRYREFDPNCDDQEASNSRENGEYKSGRSPESKNKGALDDHEEYGDPGSGRSTNGSDLFEDANDTHNMEKSMPCLTEESLFISLDLYEFLQSSIPNIVKGCQWVLLYRAVLSNMEYPFVRLFVKVLNSLVPVY